jgi:beta-galactosidase/beta-glucuronidase
VLSSVSCGRQRGMVKRDRSHPSVIVWGVCNERECYKYDVSGRPADQVPQALADAEHATAYSPTVHTVPSLPRCSVPTDCVALSPTPFSAQCPVSTDGVAL